MSKKKILFLDQYARLGGGQKVLLDIIDELRNDFDCSVILPDQGVLTEELRRRDIPYHLYPIGYYGIGKKSVLDIITYVSRIPLLSLRLKNHLVNCTPDLVYANGARTFVWATQACSRAKTPLIWHVHSIFEKGFPRALCLRYGKYETVRSIIIVSKAASRPLLPLGQKIELLYNAVDTNVFYPSPDKNGPFKKEIGANNRPLIAMVSMVLQWKGVDDFIRAAAQVAQHHPEAFFAVVGDTLHDSEGNAYKNYLSGLVERLGLKKNIVFTGFRKDIPAIMREIDIFTLPSKQPDPCPTALLQAMASGAAVIASDFGGPSEIIENKTNGLLFKPYDIQDLTHAILLLLKEPETRSLMAQRAVETIHKNYNRTEYMRTLRLIIQRALT